MSVAGSRLAYDLPIYLSRQLLAPRFRFLSGAVWWNLFPHEIVCMYFSSCLFIPHSTHHKLLMLWLPFQGWDGVPVCQRPSRGNTQHIPLKCVAGFRVLRSQPVWSPQALCCSSQYPLYVYHQAPLSLSSSAYSVVLPDFGLSSWPF